MWGRLRMRPRRFYKIQAQLCFYSFSACRGAKRILMVPSKGFHYWKSKFFYIMVAAIACRIEVRSVYQKIPREVLAIPKPQEWYGAIQGWMHGYLKKCVNKKCMK
ncbi:hypothetical protein Hanom_Chr00s000001g01597021 [Helianthus anomalus]